MINWHCCQDWKCINHQSCQNNNFLSERIEMQQKIEYIWGFVPWTTTTTTTTEITSSFTDNDPGIIRYVYNRQVFHRSEYTNYYHFGNASQFDKIRRLDRKLTERFGCGARIAYSSPLHISASWDTLIGQGTKRSAMRKP